MTACTSRTRRSRTSFLGNGFVIATAVVLAWLSLAAVGWIAKPAVAGGTRYYVDSIEGSDSNRGDSPDAAWKTVTKASSVLLEPGDSLLFRRGGDWSGRLKLTQSGARGAPIIVGAYGSGNLPVLHSGGCIDVLGSYVVIQEFHVHTCSWAGISISGYLNVVQDSVVTDNVAGIYIRPGAVGNRILGNQLRNNNRMSVLTADVATDDSGAFGVLLRGDYTEVAHNTISGSDSFSHDYGRDGAAIEVYGGIGNRIHHNLALENNMFTELGNSRSADNTFAFNVVRSRLEQAGFLTTRGSGSRYGPVTGTQAHHNTVLLEGASSHGVVCHAGCRNELLHMRNNVIQAVQVGWADAPFDEDHGIYFGGEIDFLLGPHSKVADPGFVDPALENLRLQPWSPAVDAGVSMGYTSDFDGAPVPADGNGDGVLLPDIGAFELTGDEGTGRAPSRKITPRPGSTIDHRHSAAPNQHN